MRSSLGSPRIQIILAGALLLFGFGLVTQLRSHEELSTRLEAQSERDLVEIVDKLDSEIRLMRSELSDQQLKLVSFRNSETDNQTIIRKTKAEISELQMIVGVKPAEGQGILITIRNDLQLLTGYDLRQIIEEIRASGGWAVAVNGRRLGSRSSFWRKSGNLYIDGLRIKPNMEIAALGNSSLLYQAITLPRGIRDKLSTVAGVSVSVKRVQRQRLPAARNH